MAGREAGRGHLGDGVIGFAPIPASVTAAGYEGYVVAPRAGGHL